MKTNIKTSALALIGAFAILATSTLLAREVTSPGGSSIGVSSPGGNSIDLSIGKASRVGNAKVDVGAGVTTHLPTTTTTRIGVGAGVTVPHGGGGTRVGGSAHHNPVTGRTAVRAGVSLHTRW